MGVEYLSICMILSFGSVGQILFQRLLQSTGRTGLSMVSQLVGAVFNIIFDPILIRKVRYNTPPQILHAKLRAKLFAANLRPLRKGCSSFLTC
jgi:hypothetical protein